MRATRRKNRRHDNVRHSNDQNTGVLCLSLARVLNSCRKFNLNRREKVTVDGMAYARIGLQEFGQVPDPAPKLKPGKSLSETAFAPG